MITNQMIEGYRFVGNTSKKNIWYWLYFHLKKKNPAFVTVFFSRAHACNTNFIFKKLHFAWMNCVAPGTKRKKYERKKRVSHYSFPFCLSFLFNELWCFFPYFVEFLSSLKTEECSYCCHYIHCIFIMDFVFENVSPSLHIIFLLRIS